MYKTKAHRPCDFPANEKLTVVVLNASLKHRPAISNTEEVAELVVKHMGSSCQIDAEIVRLADLNVEVGLAFQESADDEWPVVAKKIRDADVLIFATPIWWGGRSSLMQRVIERLDAFDEEAHKSGRSALYNKVAGVVITGSEDGALAVMGSIMMVLTWMGFTLPPECCAYWVGEVGFPPAGDRERRLKNPATPVMAQNMARNLVYYAQLLKKHPLIPKQ